MLRNRLCYLAVLLGSLLFFFCFNGYVSHYVLVLVIVLPFLSLAVSLPGCLGAKVELVSETSSTRKGQVVPVRLVVTNKLPVASGRAWVTLTVRNTLTGETQSERFSFTAGQKELVISHKLGSPVCGQVVLELSKGKICDYMGLVSLPLRLPDPPRKTVLFYPAVHQPEMSIVLTATPDGEGERYSQYKSGDDPSEVFAFREYREGDKMSRIHWKLSQKTGGLLVKELSLAIADHFFFLLEMNGNGQEADALLDVFATLSNFLSERDTAYKVGYWTGKGQSLTVLDVNDPAESTLAIGSLLVADGRFEPPPVRQEDLPKAVSHAMYLCCKPNRTTLNALHRKMAGGRITVLLVVDPGKPKPPVPEGVELVVIPSNRIEEALHGFEI